ncbi:hypothetical protein DACRYDRAFT_108771 [Dacryopinax primogenitus]|uniref:Uncharacterized protein n=1 Tax=Dacryopinax primogenitus (strain DJM 731) TaxID=1858805 RepID=M5FWG3_DACPD|nr:uncharacterized protein DACRYDRAFT_108771 [Dacryopinax primogenitus]EJU00704.1 hypothetical protein DACRYDRAFT_108771 [Dacryopinax primogenitus]
MSSCAYEVMRNFFTIYMTSVPEEAAALQFLANSSLGGEIDIVDLDAMDMGQTSADPSVPSAPLAYGEDEWELKEDTLSGIPSAHASTSVRELWQGRQPSTKGTRHARGQGLDAGVLAKHRASGAGDIGDVSSVNIHILKLIDENVWQCIAISEQQYHIDHKPIEHP